MNMDDKRGTAADHQPRTEDREYEMFAHYRGNRTRENRNKIFQEYVYLAEILAKKYLNRGVDYQDLFQIASIGLINAIERFDIDRGFKFTSFATPTIIGEIKKYFRDKEWMIRVPRRIQKLSSKINDAKEALTQQLGRNPGIPELAEYLLVSEEELLEAMEAGEYILHSPLMSPTAMTGIKGFRWAILLVPWIPTWNGWKIGTL